MAAAATARTAIPLGCHFALSRNRPLEAIIDRLAIFDQLALWCRLIDTRQLTRLSDIFVDDVFWDFGHGTIDRDLSAVTRRITALLGDDSTCGTTQHHLANMVVTVENDTAESEAYFMAPHAGTGPRAGQVLTQWGIYRDSWKRTPTGWRIAKRIYRITLSEGPLDIVYGNGPAHMWQPEDERHLEE
jgi:hypothetical protein